MYDTRFALEPTGAGAMVEFLGMTAASGYQKALGLFYSVSGLTTLIYLIFAFPNSGGRLRFLAYGGFVLWFGLLGLLAWQTFRTRWQAKLIGSLDTLLGKSSLAWGIAFVSFAAGMGVIGLGQVSRQGIAANFYATGAILFCASFLCLAWYHTGLDEAGKRRWAYWLRAIAVAGTPLLVSVLLVAAIFHTSIFAYLPWNSDEMMYWHQAKTFGAVGFQGGYYASYERIPVASFTHFGPHGPVYPIVYGAFGGLFGWGYASGVIVNQVLLLLAMLWFLSITKPPQSDLLYLAAGMALYSPVLLFSGASMFESFQHAGAIVLAGAFWLLMKQPLKASAKFAILAVFVFISLGRVNWLALSPALLFVMWPNLGMTKRVLAAVLGGGALSLLVFSAWQRLVSPYGEEIVLYGSQFDSYLFYLQSAGQKLGEAWSWQLHALQDYQGALVLALYGLVLLAAYRVGRGLSRGEPIAVWGEDALPLYVLLVGLVSTVLLSTTIANRGYRYLAPFLLMALLWVFLQKQRRVFLLIALLFAAYLPAFLAQYESYLKDNYNQAYHEPYFVEFKYMVEKHLVFEPNANAWCNSLLVEEDPQPFVSVPAGIGIAAKFEDEETDRYQVPLQSKYILLDRPLEGANLQPLGDTQYGTIYLNLDSDCFD